MDDNIRRMLGCIVYQRCISDQSIVMLPILYASIIVILGDVIIRKCYIFTHDSIRYYNTSFSTIMLNLFISLLEA